MSPHQPGLQSKVSPQWKRTNTYLIGLFYTANCFHAQAPLLAEHALKEMKTLHAQFWHVKPSTESNALAIQVHANSNKAHAERVLGKLQQVHVMEQQFYQQQDNSHNKLENKRKLPIPNSAMYQLIKVHPS
jgi:hypothetical protein